MSNLEQLKLLVSDSSGKYLSSRMTENYVNKIKPELVNFVKNSTSYYDDIEINFTKRIMLTLGNKSNRLICFCGKEISPMSRGESAGLFRQFCSQVCVGISNKGRKIIRTDAHQEEINLKRSETMMGVYGYAYNSQRAEIKVILSAAKYVTHNHIRYDLLNNSSYLIQAYKTLPSTEIGELCGCDYSVVLDYLRKYGVDIGGDHTKLSQEQRKLGQFISDLGFDILMNSRILSGQDIDIFIPQKNIGIEYNGFPHHLENFTMGKRDSTYHVGKTTSSIKIGVRLIHVFPHDIYEKPQIVYSIIRNALGVTINKLYGRNCTVRSVEKLTAKVFLEENHLKGNANFQYAIGLYYEDILVQVVTFGSSRFDKEYKYEIIRAASSINMVVVGGLSKCLKFFVNEYCVNGDKIMTYADRAISEGDSYVKAGFTFVRSTSPGYHYTERVNGGFKVHSRHKFQKHKLKDFPCYDVEKTEWQIMKESGYDRYWDSGNNLYKYTVQK